MNHPSLRDGAMAPLWTAVRARLELRGLDNRGRLEVPDLEASGRLTLKNLLDRRQVPRRIDLGELERAVVALGVGADLPTALAALGFEPSDEPARRRTERARGRAGRDAARRAAGSWREPWAEAWIDGVIRAGVLRGMEPEASIRIVGDTRRVLDEIDRRSAGADGPISRVDLAAQVLGSSHALDPGQRLGAAVVRALALRSGPVEDEHRVWENAGVHPDLTSGPVLTWRLPIVGGLAPMVEAATVAGLPIHLTRMALLDHPPRFAGDAEVLVVENPRVVEAAAQRRAEGSLISAGGSPSGAVQLLVRQLVEAGVPVRYHGDFDAAGLALCARMHAAGVEPWRMTAEDYLAALTDADAHGIDLPRDDHRPGPTPWDVSLQEVFDRERRIVHEERLLDELVRSSP